MSFKKGHKVWNKGLTKDTDKRIKKYSENIIGRKGWSKGLTKENDERVKHNSESNKGRKILEESIKKRIETQRKNGTLKRSKKCIEQIKKSIEKRRLSGELKKSGNKISQTKKIKFESGELNQWNKGLTKKNNPDKIKYGLYGKNNPMSKNGHTEESKRKISLANKGKNNSNWKGGLSKKGYPHKFNKELKDQIRKRDNYRCQQCFRHQDELYSETGKKYSLHIHHIDFDKENCEVNNLISLCRNCHIQTNYNREDWVNYFNKKVSS